MQTTLVNPAAVAGSGKGTNPKTTLYVGGLEETVNEALLHAAFLPFGEIKDVNIPLDHASGKNRGFGFVEYEEKEDAAAAIDNMHNSELNGRVLKVNYAQPMKVSVCPCRACCATWLGIKAATCITSQSALTSVPALSQCRSREVTRGGPTCLFGQMPTHT
jgi:RNA recognition motif-containing protein